MTALVTVQSSSELTRVRRYEGKAGGQILCTHEGFYEPDTVTGLNVLSYLYSGHAQDRRPRPSEPVTALGGHGKQPA
jgi:hypothetical protein